MDWIGVDLDGTLAKTLVDHAPGIIGEPIPSMVDFVVGLILQGETVKIFTARVASTNPNREIERPAIQLWSMQYIGWVLPVTAEKDHFCKRIYDNRARQVETDTGRIIGEEVTAG